MKKKIITLMLLSFMTIASVSNASAADRRHHRMHHPRHHHGHDHR